MSVDFNALVLKPITMLNVLRTAESVLAELVGVADPPAIRAVIGRRWQLGRTDDDGTEMTTEQLATVVIGLGRTDPGIELIDESGADLAGLVVSTTSTDCILVVSPRRDARGIVSGLAIAMAAALLGDGRVIDNDLRLVEDEADIASIVASTRLPPHDQPIADACASYLRQFPQLEGRS